MSDAGRSALDGWRRGSLLLFALAASGLVAIILSGSAMIPMVVMAVIAVASFTLYLASRRRSFATDAARSVPAEDITVMPSAARSVLECVDEPLLVLDRSGRIIFA